MKSFGRLLMAAALVVPVAGIVSAQSAGAASDNVVCTTNTGTLHASTGISLTTRQGTTFTSKNGVLDGCTGIGITAATGGVLNFTVQRTAVSCKNIKGSLFVGSGTLRWNAGGSNEGVITKLKVNLKFNSLVQVQFSGIVTSTYLHGDHIAGIASIPPNLRSAGDNGGTCGNSKASRVKNLAFTNKGDTTIG